MGFFGNIIKGVVQTAITPVAVVADVVDAATGNYNGKSKTVKNVSKAGKRFGKAIDDLGDADL